MDKLTKYQREEKLKQKLSRARYELRHIDTYLKEARDQMIVKEKKIYPVSGEFNLLMAVESIYGYLKKDLNKHLKKKDMRDV